MSQDVIKPEDFLSPAKLLLECDKIECPEAAYRTTINRCYLSVVLKAAQILEPIVGGPFPESAEYYKAVEDALIERDARTTKNQLGSLRRWRKDADYNLKKSISLQKAKFALETARYTLDYMKEEIK